MSDAAEWRDLWEPWAMEHIIALLANHPAVWGFSAFSALLLFILSWPEIKRIFVTNSDDNKKNKTINIKNQIFHHKSESQHGSYLSYASWDRFDDLALFQAACLWAGVEPKNPVPDGRASALLETLKRAVWNGELKAKLPDSNRAIIETEKKMSPGLTNLRFVPDECYVSRSALAEYASSIGERPTFLSRNLGAH